MKRTLYYHLFLCLPFLSGCDFYSPHSKQPTWQFIAARDHPLSLMRPVIYRAHVPNHWTRSDPEPSDSISDTTRPNCEFYIQDQKQPIRLTIHTFPFAENPLRIPSQAQITRWKNQFEELDLLATNVIAASHSGFSGLFFEAEGIIQGQSTKVIGWSMQLAPLYTRDSRLSPYKQADYTIKASGPPEVIDRYRDEIIAFADSFELIDELPAPL